MANFGRAAAAASPNEKRTMGGQKVRGQVKKLPYGLMSMCRVYGCGICLKASPGLKVHRYKVIPVMRYICISLMFS